MLILLWAAAGAAFYFKLAPLPHLLMAVAAVQLGLMFAMLPNGRSLIPMMNAFGITVLVTHVALPFLGRFVDITHKAPWLFVGADWIASIAAVLVILYTLAMAWANGMKYLYGLPSRN